MSTPSQPEQISVAQIKADAQKALLVVLASGELPVGARLDEGQMLVINWMRRPPALHTLHALYDPHAIEAPNQINSTLGAITVDTESGSTSQFPLTQLASTAVLNLIENGLRGKELESCLAPEPKDSAMELYDQLMSAISKTPAADQWGVIDEHMEALEDKPGVLGKIYLGQGNALKSNAYYMITQVTKTKARLQTVPVGGNNYRLTHIGADSWLDLEHVQKNMEAQLLDKKLQMALEASSKRVLKRPT